MKISHTLIHNGIIYGIPEGTKVPEKPECNCDLDGSGDFESQHEACDRRMKKYEADLQALLSVSIKWEDQDAISKLITCHSGRDGDCNWKGCPSKGECPLAQWDDYEAEKPDFEEGGIYPLEGIEAGLFWQYKLLGKWMDGSEDQCWRYSHSNVYTRKVLRLIPQHNNETTDHEGKPLTYWGGKAGGVSEEEPTQDWKLKYEELRGYYKTEFDRLKEESDARLEIIKGLVAIQKTHDESVRAKAKNYY